MDYKVKLSVIIPVYNMEPYLRRCLDSVVRAVAPVAGAAEVLIINDGSTDGSQQIIDEYCGQFACMKAFRKKNGGLSDVKNYGLQRATGEYVIFLDSDDYVEPEIYSAMLEKAEKDRADVVVCDLELVYDDKEKNTVYPCRIFMREDTFSQVIDMSMMPASWNKLVKRELYQGLSFPVGKNNEDVAVTPIVLARAKKISVVDQPYYKYYQRTGSIQNSSFDEKRFVILDTAKLCMERAAKEHLEADKLEKIRGSVYVHQVLSLAMYPIRREPLRRRYHLLKKYIPRMEALFPDLWDDPEVRESAHWDTIWIQLSKRLSMFLLKRIWYLAVSLMWEICNRFYDCCAFLKKKAEALKNGTRKHET